MIGREHKDHAPWDEESIILDVIYYAERNPDLRPYRLKSTTKSAMYYLGIKYEVILEKCKSRVQGNDELIDRFDTQLKRYEKKRNGSKPNNGQHNVNLEEHVENTGRIYPCDERVKRLQELMKSGSNDPGVISEEKRLIDDILIQYDGTFKFVARRMGIPLDDDVTEFCKSVIIESVMGYDNTKSSWNTYIQHMLRYNLLRADLKGHKFHIPVDQKSEVRRLKKRIADFRETNGGYYPTLEELMTQTNLPRSIVLKVLTEKPVSSLDKKINDDDYDKYSFAEKKRKGKKDNKSDAITEMLRILTDQEREIIIETYALNGEKKTVDELGKRFEVSPQRISAIKMAAQQKLVSKFQDKLEELLRE